MTTASQRVAGAQALVNGFVLLNVAVVAVTAVVINLSRAPAMHVPVCESVGVSTVLRGALPAAVGGTGNPLETARSIWQCSEAQRTHDETYVLSSFITVYILLQAFAIPGPLLLSVVAGALWPHTQAQVIVAACATAGASACYLLSAAFAGPLVRRYLPDRLAALQSALHSHKDNLFWYMLFLRLTPVCPNWLVNLCAPLAGVPFSTFALATLIGLVPANYFHTATGATLAQLKDATPAENTRIFLTLLALQFVAVVPMLAARMLRLKSVT